WQETTGVTPEIFADWLRRRIDAMCEAFKGVEYKLAVMWDGPFGPTAELRTATAGLHQHAIEKGAGIRGGGIDFMHGLLDAPAWGAGIDHEGYLVVDDDHPTIREGRFRGDENEEYGKYWEWRFGPVDGYPYRHRICVLRGLEMRQNFQMVSQATLELNPQLNDYARITQGYRRDNSPDAWAYLREFQRGGRPIKNIERWLIQRDAPGSQSVPAEPVDRFPLPSEQRLNVASVRDFDARRTDIQNGQAGLLFKLDRVFWDRPQPATIKVTFADRAPARWHLEYTDDLGNLQKSANVENAGDGELKTATFALPVLSATGSFPNDAAFRDWLDETPAKTGNLVANSDFADGADGWHLPEEYRVVADPDRPGKQLLQFTFRPGNDDTVHVDQLLDVEKGTAYRVTASIRNDGTNLKPGVRIAGMDWSTIVYLQSSKSGEWETLSGTFEAGEDGTVRLQLFGQGRQYAPPGQAGTARFRQVAVEAVPRRQLREDVKMDFRVVTEGPGDVAVSMVRVLKGTPSTP
ncbi:MAG: carbohydrate binding domain-containing protein, partial [Thermoguttaceae bacterium]